MKLIEMRTSVDKQGRIILPGEPLGAAGLKPGDEVRVTLAVGQEETESLCPQLIVTPQDVGVAVQLSGCQEADEEGDLTLPNDLLEAAEIPVDSDLEVVCTAGAIVIMESDILDSLPDELRELFGELGINPGTVREVMRKEGYFL
ncbi:MAG TPA: AbrB/MazE/SpoVT family DNA-binding domain-containing protein [Clostridia bacterium]|nr:AbrB/MazE/SpoVT family DNA-binding domain-containing protein [Spirochaetales bacterium]HQH66348.1 AbrB/MazE/SpoVT family DNA-binding domain-containing protein [Clostridia bacterium]HQK34358.1 AbrB/MazE/SpoVT family DNA-binding domain-containing protein [Spirochaetales bacterium]